VSSVIILYLYGGFAIAMLRGALEIHEIVAQKTSRRRLEQELHLALTQRPRQRHQDTVTAAQNSDSTLVGRPHDSGSATVVSVRRTRRIR
jgi:hypothetical protein